MSGQKEERRVRIRNESCPCTSDCPRHGDCEACRGHHKKSLTTCQRLEKKKEKEKEKGKGSA